MTKREDGITVSVRLDKELADRIDRMAEKVDLSRSKLAANLVEAELSDLKFFDSFGLVRLASGLQEIKDRIINKKAKPSGEKVYLGIWLKPETVGEIDRIAQKIQLSRSKLTGNMIEAGMPDIEFFRSMGVVDVLLFLEKLKKRVKQEK